MKFRVKYEIEINGETHSGIETEASWFLVDQQGNMYSYGPMEPVRPIEKEYKLAIPLIKINNEWLAISEIEARLNKKINITEKADIQYEDIIIKHYIADIQKMMASGLSKVDSIKFLTNQATLTDQLWQKIEELL